MLLIPVGTLTPPQRGQGSSTERRQQVVCLTLNKTKDRWTQRLFVWEAEPDPPNWIQLFPSYYKKQNVSLLHLYEGREQSCVTQGRSWHKKLQGQDILLPDGDLKQRHDLKTLKGELIFWMKDRWGRVLPVDPIKSLSVSLWPQHGCRRSRLSLWTFSSDPYIYGCVHVWNFTSLH